MAELLKNIFIYGFGGILSKLVTFLLLPIITSRLSPAEYGYYDFILTISSIAAIFGMLSFETGFQRQYYKQPTDKEKDKLISSVLFAIVLFSTIVALLVFIATPLFSKVWFDNGYRIELRLACVEILASNIVLYMLCVLLYDNKPKLYAFIAVLSAVLNALLSIYFVVVLSLGVLGALLGSVLSQCIIAFVLLFVERSHIRSVYDRFVLKDVASFSFPMLPARIGSVANTYASRFLMISLFTVEMIGLYSLAVKLASAMALVHTAFQLAWTPYVYKILNQEGHKPIIIEAFKQTVFIVSIIVVVISLFSKELVSLVSNEQYLESATIVGLLCLYNGLFLVKETAEIGVKVTGKSIYVTYAYFISVAVNFIFLFILPKHFGLVGIALSLLISNIFLTYITVYFSNRLYKINFPIKMFSIVLLLTLVVVFVSILINLPLITKLLISVVVMQLWVYLNKTTLRSLYIGITKKRFN